MTSQLPGTWTVIADRAPDETAWRPVASACCTVEDAKHDAARGVAETRQMSAHGVLRMEVRKRP